MNYWFGNKRRVREFGVVTYFFEGFRLIRKKTNYLSKALADISVFVVKTVRINRAHERFYISLKMISVTSSSISFEKLFVFFYERFLSLVGISFKVLNRMGFPSEIVKTFDFYLTHLCSFYCQCHKLDKDIEQDIRKLHL